MKKSALLDASLIAQLDHLELVVRRLFAGRTQGEKRSKRRGTGSEFADYREYTQGDDLRHIDWNVYGRLDRLFLKLFHVEEDLRLSIFVDNSLSMDFGSPTKLFEYMAMGKAIVASRLGQIGEVLVDNETAVLVEPGSARELADAILRLSGSRDLRERLGAAARRAAIERHTWKQNAQRVIDVYRALSEPPAVAGG